MTSKEAFSLWKRKRLKRGFRDKTETAEHGARGHRRVHRLRFPAARRSAYLHDGPSPGGGAVVVIDIVCASLCVLPFFPARREARRGVHVGHGGLFVREITVIQRGCFPVCSIKSCPPRECFLFPDKVILRVPQTRVSRKRPISSRFKSTVG